MAGSALPFGELTVSPSAGTRTFPVSPFLLLPPSVLFSSPLYLLWPLRWPSVPPMALFLTLPFPGDEPGLLEELGTTPAPRMLHRAEEHCTSMPSTRCSGQTDGQMDAQVQHPKISLSCSSRSSGRACALAGTISARFGHHVGRWEALVYLFQIPQIPPVFPPLGSVLPSGVCSARLHPVP